MKTIKVFHVSLLAVCAFGFNAVHGVTGDWLLRSGIGEAIDTPALWSESENWRDGTVPSATGDGAYLTNALAAPLYVKTTGALSISWLQGVAGQITDTTVCPYIVSDSGVTLNTSNRNPFFSGVRLYADFSAPSAYGNAHMNSCFLCGDVAMYFMSLSSGTAWHRLDLYANAAGETRTNPLSITTYRNSWGAFRVVAPEGSPTNVVGQWTLTEGSPYIVRTGAKHVISAGTLVHGTGIGEGTFVKRVFSDALVELSEAAGSSAAGADLTFDAFTANVTVRVDGIARQNTSTDNIQLLKYREEDVLRCALKTISGGANNICVFDTTAGFVPGTYVTARIANSTLPQLRLGDCHFEFVASDEGDSGFPNAYVKVIGSDDHVRLTVQDGVTASILGITNLVGTVVKDGLGTLKTSFNVQSSLNTGTIVVKEGTLDLSDADGVGYVRTLAISNGATLKLPPNGLRVDSVVYEPGAVVTGDGALYLPTATSLDGLTFSGGAAVGFFGGAGDFIVEPPTPAVVGNPAFWVDVSDEDSRTTVTDGDVTRVTRLNDVRGAAYGFATNVVNAPVLIVDSVGLEHIYFEQVTATSGIVDACPLVWDKFVYGIRHVFLVQCPASGGGEILGVSDALWNKHYQAPFLRDPGSAWNHSIVWGGGIGDVVNGRFAVNGENRDNNAGYPYSGVYSYSKDTYYTPVVVEASPLSGVHADCFGYNGSRNDRNGRVRLCECVVYTNELTQAERIAVTGYLMKKWLNAEVPYPRGPAVNSFGTASLSAGAPGYAVAEGETGWIDGVSGNGTLMKCGAGTLTVAELSDADADVVVSDGTLKVASVRLTESTLPAGAYLHVDASAADTLTTNVVDGVTRVTAWASVNAGGETLNAIASSTNKAVYAATACNGKPAIDFGPRRNVNAEGVANARPDLRFDSGKAKKASFRTVLALLDSSQGGGSIVPNCGNGYNDGYGLVRYNYGMRTATEDALVWNSGRPGNTLDNGIGTGVTRARVNGSYIAAKSTGLSGGWDIVSLANHYVFGASGLGSDHYGYYIGGAKISEYILYPQMLSRQTVEAVEAYLREKWLGIETPGYRATRAKSVSVASGATLDLCGGDMTTAALSGNGSVVGEVTLSPGGTIGNNGLASALTVTWTLTLPGDGVLSVYGIEPRELVAPRYVIACCSTLSAPSLTGWSVVFPDAQHATVRRFSLKAEGGELVLVMTLKGGCISFR